MGACGIRGSIPAQLCEGHGQDTSTSGPVEDGNDNYYDSSSLSGVEGEFERPSSPDSAYAVSLYPGLQTKCQTEEAFDNVTVVDAITISSSRSLYAEDVDYVEENGRQYCGDYFLPIDETEQTRQYVVHQVYLKLFDLELTTVPLRDPTYILDIGTGIGEWAIGMAEIYPDCEVFGTDIAPIQPTQQVPFNVEFHIESAEEEWLRPANAVDLVHLRDLAGAFSDWSFIYREAFSCIKPGGWIEIIELDNYGAYQNFLTWYPKDSKVHILVDALAEAAAISGRARSVEHMDPQLLVAAGFTDIKESVHDLGLGQHENSSFGSFWLFACVTGIEATCLRVLTKYLKWDAAYVRSLCDDAARETKRIAEDRTRAKGFAVKLRVLTGRKPFETSQWTVQDLQENGRMVEYSADDVEQIWKGSRPCQPAVLQQR